MRVTISTVPMGVMLAGLFAGCAYDYSALGGHADDTGSGGSGVAGTGGHGTGGQGTGGRGTAGSGTGGIGPGTGGAAFGGSGAGGAGMAGAAGGGLGSAGAAGADSAQYNFESSVQSFTVAAGTPTFTVARSTVQHFAGAASLSGAITSTGVATFQFRVVPTPAIPPGATVTFHLYVPVGAAIDWVQPYVQEAGPSYLWTGTAVGYAAGSWITVSLVVPAATTTVGALGAQFHTTGPWTGTVYLDSIGW